MEIKIKGANSSWGFVETYSASNSGKSRTIRFLAGIDVNTMSLVAPSTFFGQEFQELQADDVERYCKSKKPLHSKMGKQVLPVYFRVQLRHGVVTVSARPVKAFGNVSPGEVDVVLGPDTPRIADAVHSHLSAFIEDGSLDRKVFYKERVSWARKTN